MPPCHGFWLGHEWSRALVNQKEQGKAEIAEILSVRSDQYTHAVVKAALVLDEDGQWRNCLTSIQLCDDQPTGPKSLIYPGFEIHEIVKKPKQVLELIDALVAEDKLPIAGRVIEIREGRFDRFGPGRRVGQRVRSGESWVPSEWPGDQYLFGARREANPPSDPLVALGMPAYPDGFAAIEHILGMDTRGGRTWDGGVVLFFPDFRAKIDSVTLGIESVSVKIVARKLTLDELVGKVYARSKVGMVLQRDFEFGASEEKIDLGLNPEHIYVGILCKADGQTLDEWGFSPFRQSPKVKVELFTPQYVQQLIAQGEDSYVEFKPGLRDDTAKKEMAESAIAFSNKNGGIILIGIDDNGKIEGAFGDGWEDLIAQSLRDRCEPPIEPTVRRAILEDKPVYVVLIPESNNKPHLLRGTGTIYLRVAGTDKPATRYELDELFNRKSGRVEWPHSHFP
jgi:hypothetical protein